MAAKLSGNWQAALVWENDLAAEAFKLAGIPRRLGPDGGKLKKLLTHPLGFVAGPLEHRVRYYLAAVEELGIETAQPAFFAPAALGIEPVAGAVLLCPDSDYGPSHEWLLERWLEIATRLLEASSRVTVASVDGGSGMGKILAQKFGDTVECAPCLLPRCPLDRHCQNELDLERVWHAVNRVLSSPAFPQAP